MTYEQQLQQLNEALDLLDQAKAALTDLAAGCVPEEDGDLDDDADDAALDAEDLENAVAVLEELIDTLDSLR